MTVIEYHYEQIVYGCFPLAPDPSHLEIEIAIAKLKKYKSPGSNQIPAAGGETLVSVIHKHNSIWNKEELHDQW
jgi:hypothetical protein